MLDYEWNDEEADEEGAGFIYCEVCNILTNHWTESHEVN